MNNLYPIFLKLEHQPILVIGGGKISEQKVRGLLEVNANVTVISPTLNEALEHLAGQNKIIVHRREYRTGDVDGYALIFAATNNPAVHQIIYDDALSQNIPVNVVDVPDLCNFYLASTFQSGDLKVAVSTNGKSPTLGKIIRDRIAVEFGKGYPELLDTLGEIRPSVHSIYYNPDKRKEVLEKIVDDELKKQNLFSQERNDDKSPTSDRETTTRHGKYGKVILVGSGPGDPELLTIKGLRAIQQAEVIAYDALVNSEILSHARYDCEKIFVGKRSDGHYVHQQETNNILIVKAKEGKTVVRLKGGDPFVFGRGGEELQVLRAEGIQVDIIPGITAGIGIPSSLGIPLTHRGIASNIVFVTGSEITEKPHSVRWRNVAALDTIVVYMGIKKIRSIMLQLCDFGVPKDKPVAAVFGGTLPQQRIVEGNLHDISDKVERIETDAPGIIIIGEVVRFLHDTPIAEQLSHTFAVHHS